MAYVDLNSVRAGIVNDIDAYQAASCSHRTKIAVNQPARLAAAIEPLVIGVRKDRPVLAMSLGEYMNIVDDGVRDCVAIKTKDKKSRWFERISMFKKRQRAFGPMKELSSWRIEQDWALPGSPMPAI